MDLQKACPQCGSECYKRNEHIDTGKQNHRCKAWAEPSRADSVEGAARTQVSRSAARRGAVSGCAARSRQPLEAASA
jgi:hypothetical protein